MNPDSRHHLGAWIATIPHVAGTAAILAGTIVLVGWLLDIPVLKSLHPGLVSMKANTALAFVLAGFALLILSMPGGGTRLIVARSLGWVVGVVGLLNVLQYAFAWDLGIDQLMFSEPEGTVGTFAPGRMPLNSAIGFCLLGLAIVTGSAKNRRGMTLAQTAGLIVGLLGLLALLAYVYGVSEFAGLAIYARLALHTTVLFILLSVGVLCLRPDVGVMAVISAQGPGGYMARRLMLAAIGLPVLLGWLVAQGELGGWYGNQFGEVIAATASVAIFVFLIWKTGRSLNQQDAERADLQQAIFQSEQEYRDLFDDAPVGYHELDREGRITRVNETELKLLGYQAGEMLGRFVWEFLEEQESSRQSVLAKLTGEKPPAKGVERLYRRKDLTIITVLSEDRLLRDAEDRIAGIRTTLLDIAKLKRAQELLHQSEERHRALVQNLAEGVGIVDEEERFGFANPAAEAIFGVALGSLVGRSLQEFMDPGAFEAMRRQTAQRRRGETTTYEIEINRPDGEKRDLLVTVSPFLGSEGNFVGTLGIFRDLTDRKAAEKANRITQEALRKSEERFRQVAESAGEWIWETDSEGLFTYSSAAVRSILGYHPWEIVGRKHFYDLFTPDIRDAFKEAALAVFARRDPIRGLVNPNLHKNGSVVILETTGVPVLDDNGALLGYRGADTDITLRKQAEDSLKQSVSLLQATLESTADGILVVDKSGKIEGYNKEFVKMWAIPDDVIESRDDDRALNHVLGQLKDPEAFISKVRYLYAHPEESSFDVLGFTDGRIVERYSQPQRVEAKPVGRVWSFRDITERKFAEEALVVERSLLRALIDNLPDTIYVKDAACRKTLANPVDVRNMGASSEAEVLGKTDFDFYPREVADAYYADDQSVIQSGQPVLNREEMITLPDEAIGWQVTSKVPLRGSAGQVIGLVGIGHDITEHKRAEQERESLIDELKTALENVRTLSGLIPICSHCKKIRDDKGYWNQLEKYILDHTEANLTHGICPDCAKLYFPGIAAKT